LLEKIKLSQLEPDTNIVYGSKIELACTERLFLDIYEGRRKRKVIAIINGKNYEIEYDVKREQVKEEVVVCCNHNKEVDKNISRCPFGCDDLADEDDYGSCLEIRHLLA